MIELWALSMPLIFSIFVYTSAKERKLLVVRDIRNLGGGAFTSRAWPPTMLSGKPFGVQRAYLFLCVEESVSRECLAVCYNCIDHARCKNRLSSNERDSTITSRRKLLSYRLRAIYIAKINTGTIASILYHTCFTYTSTYTLTKKFSYFISFLYIS